MKLFLLSVFTLVIALSSCQNKKNDNTEKESDPLIIGAMSSMDFVPVAVANKMNFFHESGVDVIVEKFYSANDRDAAFQSGNVDGTVIDYTGALLQKAGGIKLKLTSSCNAPFAIVASPGGTIKSINEMKGAKISVSRNTVIDFCIDMALQSANMTENDIEKIEINKIPLRFEMLLKGEIQVTALPDPFLTMASANGCHYITDMKELGYQVTGIMFSQHAIDKKKDKIEAFYNAYNKGVDYIKSHPAEEIRDILVKEAGFPEELISKVILPDYTHAQLPTEKDIQTTSDWLKNKKLIPDNFNASDVLDKQFIK